MTIYLASRYSRREELCGYRTQLEAAGHKVTSRWLNGQHQISDSGTPIGDSGEALVEGDSGSSSHCAAELRQRFAAEDVLDVLAAECIVSFTEPPRSGHSRGGRHVEFGIGLGAALTSSNPPLLIVVGHRENLFHWMPYVVFYDTWGEAFSERFQALPLRKGIS